MNETPNQKNIIHGSIRAVGNVHIGDIIYNIEHDFNTKSPPQYFQKNVAKSHWHSHISTPKLFSEQENNKIHKLRISSLPCNIGIFRQKAFIW
jgi:hypothetical protein